MYVYFGVLMMYAILKYTPVSKEGMPSINGPSIDWKWLSCMERQNDPAEREIS